MVQGAAVSTPKASGYITAPTLPAARTRYDQPPPQERPWLRQHAGQVNGQHAFAGIGQEYQQTRRALFLTAICRNLNKTHKLGSYAQNPWITMRTSAHETRETRTTGRLQVFAQTLDSAHLPGKNKRISREKLIF